MSQGQTWINIRNCVQYFEQLFFVDNLTIILMLLIGFVSVTVLSFSRRYLKGDAKYKSFNKTLILLVAMLFTMVSADNMLLFFIAWISSNFLLTRLMLHKAQWKAARASAKLTLQSFVLGFLALGLALTMLYITTGQRSLQAVIHSQISSPILTISLSLILLSAMIQSAIWPFHRWLLSSLNSPTPVSAIMHAGLVNGGGFLLARFAPLYLTNTALLQGIFIVGIITAVIGTAWKLMQNDIKRMLACSTMGQMGFMIAQCGLGLFPAAVAHLCWHGLFKGYLFLGSGKAAQEQRLDLAHPPKVIEFILAILAGALGATVFAIASFKNINAGDTTTFLIAVAMIAGAQLALPIIRTQIQFRFLLAILVTSAMGGLYGLSVYSIEYLLSPLNLMQPQPLNILHIAAFSILFLAWVMLLFGQHLQTISKVKDWKIALYVKMLNASQPHPSTVTAQRNHYQY